MVSLVNQDKSCDYKCNSSGFNLINFVVFFFFIGLLHGILQNKLFFENYILLLKDNFIFIALILFVLIACISFYGMFFTKVFDFLFAINLIALLMFLFVFICEILYYPNLILSYGYFISFLISGTLLQLIVFIVTNNTLDSRLVSFVGLYSKNSFLAIVLIVSLLSLACIPLLPQFYFLFNAIKIVLETNLIVGLLILSSLLAVVCFVFKLIYLVLIGDNEFEFNVDIFQKMLMLIFVIGLIFIGLFPTIFVNFLMNIIF